MNLPVTLELPIVLVVGLLAVCAFYAGKAVKWLRLPSLIGFMLVGVIAGPSILNIVHEELQEALSFITEIALAFVALVIGLELNIRSLRKQGKGIITIIFAESFGAFIVVTVVLYLLTRNLALALIFGAIAPASAPAGTVAVIQEYKAKGRLTKVLYAVVGFDDGLGIMIFGFVAAIAKTLLNQQAGGQTEGLLRILSAPFVEIVGGIIVGIIMAILFCLLARRLKDRHETFIMIFAFVLATTGLCVGFHLSIILTNMVVGMIVINTQSHAFVQRIREELSNIMPLLFILFFALAGTNLHVDALPKLGIIGLAYVLARSAGLIGGSRIGAIIGKAHENIRKYIGLGILSQAGVAIGLSLIVKHEFGGIGRLMADAGAKQMTTGDYIGATVITTITATCIFFELVGPILTKIILIKAGEIKEAG